MGSGKIAFRWRSCGLLFIFLCTASRNAKPHVDRGPRPVGPRILQTLANRAPKLNLNLWWTTSDPINRWLRGTCLKYYLPSSERPTACAIPVGHYIHLHTATLYDSESLIEDLEPKSYNTECK